MLGVMNTFGGVQHSGDLDLDTPQPTKGKVTESELLDYMVLVLSRNMSCSAAFKGGYTSNSVMPANSRMTHDIDFSIAKTGDYEEVKRILRHVCERFKEQGYITNYVIKESISENRSGGVDMYNEDGKKILGVDVGLHNISFGIKHYNLSFTEIDGFTVERMLADKIIAITTRKRFRRTKDLYDLYAITNYFNVDMLKLAEFIRIRGGAEWDNIPFDSDVLVEYEKAWNKLNIEAYNPMCVISKPNFNEVLSRFYKIALPIKYGDNVKEWDSKNEMCL